MTKLHIDLSGQSIDLRRQSAPEEKIGNFLLDLWQQLELKNPQSQGHEFGHIEIMRRIFSAFFEPAENELKARFRKSNHQIEVLNGPVGSILTDCFLRLLLTWSKPDEERRLRQLFPDSPILPLFGGQLRAQLANPRIIHGLNQPGIPIREADLPVMLLRARATGEETGQLTLEKIHNLRQFLHLTPNFQLRARGDASSFLGDLPTAREEHLLASVVVAGLLRQREPRQGRQQAREFLANAITQAFNYPIWQTNPLTQALCAALDADTPMTEEALVEINSSTVEEIISSMPHKLQKE